MTKIFRFITTDKILMTHSDMSGSEDGQLESPHRDRNTSGDEEHDHDSLDIKPPQAAPSYNRDLSNIKRKEKSNRDKKHSKEKRHKERGIKDRDKLRDSNKRDERDRHSDISDRRDYRKDDRNNIYQRGGSGYDDDNREMLPNHDRRYQKHYERMGEHANNRGVSHAGYHHYQQYHQHQSQMHMQHQRHDFYERNQNYQHDGGDYYNNRNQPYGGKHAHVDYGHHDVSSMDMQPRERRKYNYEPQKDADSLEQDLRSRLLSKRHKYVNDRDQQQQYEVRNERRVDYERNDRNLEERDRNAPVTVKARHKERDVIEVLDSPEMEPRERKKQKRNKEKEKEREKIAVVVENRKTIEDPELVARRSKILAAEREKEKLKETAREELKARRELKRARQEVINVLSPSVVAASVTAGLNVVKRKHKDKKPHIKRKRSKKERNESEEEGEDVEDADSESRSDDDDDSDSEEDSEESDCTDMSDDSEESYVNSKSRTKTKKKSLKPNIMDSDDEMIPVTATPLSIGELSKSPKRSKKKKHKKHRKHAQVDADDDEEEDDDNDDDGDDENEVEEVESVRLRRPRTASRSPLMRSRSRSHSADTHSLADSGSPSRTSRSRSGTRSHSMTSRSRSRSLSHSSSRSRSKEQDLEIIKEDEIEKAKQKLEQSRQNSPCRDEKGVPLPNYFPGVQGCRSVEEFQCLNRIEEGTYGVVYRARDKRTSEIVALKRLKMEKEKEGFPITSLREINTLLKGQHPNIVTVREIVVGSNMDKIFIVMDYVEHDLKSLMETMKNKKQSFFPGEVKCLTEQLLRAVRHLHDNWILHRDLKTSNLLLSHKGILKVGDFGLAREYGSPLKKYTSLVVTLWYRAPELLLCSPEYSTPIDMWSLGCIFAEFLQMSALFPGKSEIDQLNKIFKILGTPNEKVWPGYKELPAVKNMLSQNSQFTEYPVSNVRKYFHDKTSEIGIAFLQGLLTFDPKQRLTADAALKHPYFKELPLPIDPSMFPTWPAKSELGARKANASSPKPPSGGSQFKQLGRDDVVASTSKNSRIVSGIITGNKKTATNTGFVLNAGIEQRQVAMGPGFNLKF